MFVNCCFFFFQAEDGIRDLTVTGVQTCALPISFTVQPTGMTAGSVITPAVQVTVQDGLGNTATSYTGNVVIAIGNNAGGGTLSGTATVAAASGVASFPGLSIQDRKSTRLNSSHSQISYARLCFTKKRS